MTAMCEVPNCRAIISGPTFSALMIPDENVRNYEEFTGLQTQLAHHLDTEHKQYMGTLHGFANLAGLYFVAKCFNSSDPEYSAQLAKQAEHLKSLLYARVTMTPAAAPIPVNVLLHPAI